MSSFLNISEAASLALHTMGIMAENPTKIFANKELAARLMASEAHLAKVMQKLVRAGLLKSKRGPKGGFIMAKEPDEVSLIQIYEAVEGPITVTQCLFGEPICNGECILGGFLERVTKELAVYLEETTLSQVSHIFKCQDCEVKHGNYA